MVKMSGCKKDLIVEDFFVPLVVYMPDILETIFIADIPFEHFSRTK